MLSFAALAAVVVILITDRGEITIKTDDPEIEVVVRKNGELVCIQDRKSGSPPSLLINGKQGGRSGR